jgi:hypothetical protein
MSTTAPFKKLQDAFITRHVPGTDLAVGQRVTVVNVLNQGTKRNPAWRFYVTPAAWIDADALSPTNPLE